jgi:hypothetical protein
VAGSRARRGLIWTVAIAAALVGGGARTAASGASHSAPKATVSILTKTAPLRGSAVKLRLSCAKGEAIRLTCRGRLTLEVIDPEDASFSAIVGRERFAIPSCCASPPSSVRVHLNRLGLALLKSDGQMQVQADARLDHSKAHDTRPVKLLSHR